MSHLIEIAIKNKNQIKHYELSSSLAMTIMRLPSLWSKDYNEFKKRMEYFENEDLLDIISSENYNVNQAAQNGIVLIDWDKRSIANTSEFYYFGGITLSDLKLDLSNTFLYSQKDPEDCKIYNSFRFNLKAGNLKEVIEYVIDGEIGGFVNGTIRELKIKNKDFLKIDNLHSFIISNSNISSGEGLKEDYNLESDIDLKGKNIRLYRFPFVDTKWSYTEHRDQNISLSELLNRK
tara:strand:- start:2233 stop:2934 length:702 start_codon:yes stop_codon:yes gene_type:complete